ncbi:hypothetical protein WJX73_008926 [Symbiochloris irregularis]|uniref:GH26 domain-containing protein n=1 Tax=Symbiochloris irregularis TaxID=706552 RepID=A0AAW1NP22_9CHLO
MDTNSDGNLDTGDDPFMPYYPGDEYVDWVGTTIDHFGGAMPPFLENSLPTPNQFAFLLTDPSNKLGNLYGRFSGDAVHSKPMVICETAAMYLPHITKQASQLAIKQAWWEQAFNVQGDSASGPDIFKHYPNIRALLWFDIEKVEATTDGLVADWQFSANKEVRQGLVKHLSQKATYGKAKGVQYWKMLDDMVSQGHGEACSRQKPKFLFHSPPPLPPPSHPPLPLGAFLLSPPPPPSPAQHSSARSPPAPLRTPVPAGCDDVTPPGGWSCQQQKEWGKCSASWMVSNDWCRHTCGQC